MTPSVSFWDGADLEPRAKVREAFCHPLWGKEPPLRPLLPLAERRQGEGKSQIWEPGGPHWPGQVEGPRPWPLFIHKVPSPNKLQRLDSKSAASVI